MLLGFLKMQDNRIMQHTKLGIIGFTTSLAEELASRNILVNAIAPVFIETDRTNVLQDEVKENIKIHPVEDFREVLKYILETK